MKTKLIILTPLLFILLIAIVKAPWASLSSGYAIWTNYHGEDIPVGTEVTATAGTTEHPNSSRHNDFPNVTAVRFVWMPPDGSGDDIYNPPLGQDPINLTWDGETTYEGWPVYTANDTQTLDLLGDWGVQAWFYNEGHLKSETGVTKIRAVSVNTVPTIPVVGTAGAIAVMLLTLGLFWHKKRKLPTNKTFPPS